MILKGYGARNRVRTGDLNLGKVALYQLSYSRFQLLVIKRTFPDAVNAIIWCYPLPHLCYRGSA